VAAKGGVVSLVAAVKLVEVKVAPLEVAKEDLEAEKPARKKKRKLLSPLLLVPKPKKLKLKNHLNLRSNLKS
jgi:hypothetical protein